MSFSRSILAAACLALTPFAATAQVLALSDVVDVRLLEGWRQADGRHMSGLEIRLAPGWKTYWRSPGDGGVPTVLTLDVGQPEMHWPSPDVFFTGTMRSIGYEGDVILPLELTLDQGDQRVRGRVEMGVCQDVCMPRDARDRSRTPGRWPA